MVKRHLVALLATATCLFTAAPALAQAFDGPGQQPIVYPLIAGADEILGDSSDAHGGIPANASLTAPIASNFDTTLWMDANCKMVGATPCGAGTGYAPQLNGSVGEEPKFRTHCNVAKVGWFDPILYPGQANAGHAHIYAGNTAVTKDSTYSSLRTTGDSTCGGGQINRSAYWVPCLMLGANKCLKYDEASVYYNIPDKTQRAKYVPVPPGFTYVWGANPADMNDTRVKGIINANNGRPGQTAVYEYPGVGAYWVALTSNQEAVIQGPDAPNPNQAEQPYFRKKDGSWSMTIPANGYLNGNVNMPECMDGKNNKSPEARRHVMPVVREINSGKFYCPNGWYRIAAFQWRMFYSVSQAEIASGNLFLSSDRMGDPSTWTNEGATIHNDWFGAWDPPTMLAWQLNCNGMTPSASYSGPSSSTGASCIDTAYGQGQKGITDSASPTGRNPQLNLTLRQTTKGVYRYYPVVRPQGTVNIHAHGMTM